MFAIEEPQERVDVCGEDPNVTLAGRVHVNPAGEEGETDSVTIPVRPLVAVTMIVELPSALASICAGATVAAIVKSTTMKLFVVVV